MRFPDPVKVIPNMEALSKISESIEDLCSDDYGYCASCGIEIGIRRLEARPTATRCIDCKTLEEIHERQQYG